MAIMHVSALWAWSKFLAISSIGPYALEVKLLPDKKICESLVSYV
jgi:hypothetical protein